MAKDKAKKDKSLGRSAQKSGAKVLAKASAKLGLGAKAKKKPGKTKLDAKKITKVASVKTKAARPNKVEEKTLPKKPDAKRHSKAATPSVKLAAKGKPRVGAKSEKTKASPKIKQARDSRKPMSESPEVMLIGSSEEPHTPSEGPSEVVPAQPTEEVVLTDAEGRRYCRLKDCDQIATVDSYCRYHYLLHWKKIQVRKKILSEGRLARYIEELTSRYPDKYLETIRKDLKTEKDFLAAIQELEIDDSADDNEFEDEAQSYIDEVRGISTEPQNRDDDEF